MPQTAGALSRCCGGRPLPSGTCLPLSMQSSFADEVTTLRHRRRDPKHSPSRAVGPAPGRAGTWFAGAAAWHHPEVIPPLQFYETAALSAGTQSSRSSVWPYGTGELRATV